MVRDGSQRSRLKAEAQRQYVYGTAIRAFRRLQTRLSGDVPQSPSAYESISDETSPTSTAVHIEEAPDAVARAQLLRWLERSKTYDEELKSGKTPDEAY